MVGDYMVSVSTFRCDTASTGFTRLLTSIACVRSEARWKDLADLMDLPNIQTSRTCRTSHMLYCITQDHRRHDLINAGE
jgi:hypothetical protein